MTPSAGTRAGGETPRNPFLLLSKKLQVMFFMHLVFLKILFEERLQRRVFRSGFCESTCLDSIILGNLILKY